MQTQTLHSENELLEHNVKSTEQLFKLYNALNFIYPAKMEKLNAVFDLVKQTWQKAIQLNFPLFWVSTTNENACNIMATGTSWQYLNNGMIAQHLASNNPVGSRIIFLGMLNRVMENQHTGLVNSYQIYYRPQNKYSSRVFDPLPFKAGKNLCEIIPYNYFEVPFLKIDCKDNIEVVEITNGDNPEFINFLAEQRGAVFIKSQELESDDINLEELNAKFKKNGLKRTRRIFAAKRYTNNKVYGVIVVNQSSIGLNFSFFENSCELILCKKTNLHFLLKIAHTLLFRASQIIAMSPLKFLPALTDPVHTAIVEQLNGKLTRNYNLFMMLKGGYEAWYDHVDQLTGSVFQRFINHSYETNS